MTTSEVKVGSWVTTSDGQEVGRVAEVSPHSIKVSAPTVSDYWLGSEFIAECEEGRVSLNVPKEDLNAAKQATPAD
jgi:hypothetical protein